MENRNIATTGGYPGYEGSFGIGIFDLPPVDLRDRPPPREASFITAEQWHHLHTGASLQICPDLTQDIIHEASTELEIEDTDAHTTANNDTQEQVNAKAIELEGPEDQGRRNAMAFLLLLMASPIINACAPDEIKVVTPEEATPPAVSKDLPTVESAVPEFLLPGKINKLDSVGEAMVVLELFDESTTLYSVETDHVKVIYAVGDSEANSNLIPRSHIVLDRWELDLLNRIAQEAEEYYLVRPELQKLETNMAEKIPIFVVYNLQHEVKEGGYSYPASGYSFQKDLSDGSVWHYIVLDIKNSNYLDSLRRLIHELNHKIYLDQGTFLDESAVDAGVFRYFLDRGYKLDSFYDWANHSVEYGSFTFSAASRAYWGFFIWLSEERAMSIYELLSHLGQSCQQAYAENSNYLGKEIVELYDSRYSLQQILAMWLASHLGQGDDGEHYPGSHVYQEAIADHILVPVFGRIERDRYTIDIPPDPLHNGYSFRIIDIPEEKIVIDFASEYLVIAQQIEGETHFIEPGTTISRKDGPIVCVSMLTNAHVDVYLFPIQ